MKRIIVAAAIAAAVIAAFMFAPEAGGRKQAAEIGGAAAPENIRTERYELIDNYFGKRNMPLAGTGKVMVEAAEKYGIDWRLLPAIAVRESSGGKEACGKNPFGWGSCQKGIGTFTSWAAAIDTVAKALGTGKYYAGKTLRQKLETYNPPSIVPAYADEVMAIMESIGPAVLP